MPEKQVFGEEKVTVSLSARGVKVAEATAEIKVYQAKSADDPLFGDKQQHFALVLSIDGIPGETRPREGAGAGVLSIGEAQALASELTALLFADRGK